MKKQGFLKGSLILMASALISKVLGAIFKIPLTNILGGVGMSYFSCAYSIFLPIYALIVTGLSSAVAKLTAESVAFEMYDNAKRVKRVALSLFSLIGIIGMLVILLLSKPFAIYIGDCKEATLAVKLIAPSVLFGCIVAVERGYYEGLSNMYPTAFSQLIEGIVKLISGLFLCSYVVNNSAEVLSYFPKGTDIKSIAAAAGILGVTLSSIGAMLFFPIIHIFTHKNTIEPKDKTLISKRDIAKELLMIAIPIGAAAVVTNLTSLIDMGTITSIIGSNPANYKAPLNVSLDDKAHFLYGSFAGITLTIFNLVPSVTNMLGKGVLPSITEAWASKDKVKLEKNTMSALKTSLFIAMPSAVGMGVLAEKIVFFLYSGQPDEASISIAPLRYMMIGMLCLCISFPVFSMLQAIGKPSIPLKIMILGALLKLIGNILLIPISGINGASISTSICYGFILIISIIIYLKKTSIRLSIKQFVPIIYSSISCGIIAWICDTQLTPLMSPSLVLFISTLAGGSAYLGVMYLIKKLK